MSSKKQTKYFKYIDIIRLIACISILFYHLGILKGGYLAVCTFFVLSGYLSCKKALNKDKFSIFNYYKNRLVKVYLPLVLVVFVTIAFLSFFPNITWLNLKNETTSVLLGYNNFWQLSSNLDYFARSVHSPFLHFWYLAILMQLDLIFPFLYLTLQKMGKKGNKVLSCAIPFVLAVISFLCFYKTGFNESILFSYYHTFTRSFSWLLGISLAFIHTYFGSTISKNIKKKTLYKKIFWIYVGISLFLFVFVSSSSLYYSLSMLAITWMSCRMIEYATLITMTKKEAAKQNNKWVLFFSKMSYPIYLVQYPIIFLFQYVPWHPVFKIPVIILITLGISYSIYFCFGKKQEKKNKKRKRIKYGLSAILLLSAFYGMFVFITSKNYTLEMKELKELLAQNEKMLMEKQEEYQNRMQEEASDWAKKLEDLEHDAENMEELVKNLPIVGIGDSVMLGAVDNLYKEFPNGYFDAQVSRSVWAGKEILQGLKEKGLLKGPIVFNLGANGDCSTSCKNSLIELSKENEVFWLTVTNDEDVHVNSNLFAMAEEHQNMHIIDWNTISKGHDEYFYADGIHLTIEGRVAYTKAIKEEISRVYKELYQQKKKAMIEEHEEMQKNKISFYGNNLFLNAFVNIHEEFPDALFTSNQNYTFELLKKDIEKAIQENTLNYKVVLVLDKTTYLTSSDYKKIVELCGDRQIYILTTTEEANNTLANLGYENVHVMNFWKEMQEHSEYIRSDGVHLTEEGNKAFSSYLKQFFTIEE